MGPQRKRAERSSAHEDLDATGLQDHSLPPPYRARTERGDRRSSSSEAPEDASPSEHEHRVVPTYEILAQAADDEPRALRGYHPPWDARGRRLESSEAHDDVLTAAAAAVAYDGTGDARRVHLNSRIDQSEPPQSPDVDSPNGSFKKKLSLPPLEGAPLPGQ